MPGGLRLSQRNGKQGVVIVGQKAFAAHGSSVPAAPVVRTALRVESFKTATVEFSEHREENSIGFLLAAQIVERGQREEGKGSPALVAEDAIRLLRRRLTPSIASMYGS